MSALQWQVAGKRGNTTNCYACATKAAAEALISCHMTDENRGRSVARISVGNANLAPQSPEGPAAAPRSRSHSPGTPPPHQLRAAYRALSARFTVIFKLNKANGEKGREREREK